MLIRTAPEISAGISGRLDKLRQQINALEGHSLASSAAGLSFHLADIDRHLPPEGLSPVALHEFVADSDNLAPSAGLLCALLAQKPGIILWIVSGWRPYPPGLAAFGLKMENVVFVEAYKEADHLWALEEGARLPGLAAVIGMARPDLTATRRLQLASEKSGTPAFLFRPGPPAPSACATRWRVVAAPSEPEDGLPGLGQPRWRAELLKARNSKPGQWLIEWNGSCFTTVIPAQAGIHGPTGQEIRQSRGGGMDPGLRRDDENRERNEKIAAVR